MLQCSEKFDEPVTPLSHLEARDETRRDAGRAYHLLYYSAVALLGAAPEISWEMTLVGAGALSKTKEENKILLVSYVFNLLDLRTLPEKPYLKNR